MNAKKICANTCLTSIHFFWLEKSAFDRKPSNISLKTAQKLVNIDFFYLTLSLWLNTTAVADSVQNRNFHDSETKPAEFKGISEFDVNLKVKLSVYRQTVCTKHSTVLLPFCLPEN